MKSHYTMVRHGNKLLQIRKSQVVQECWVPNDKFLPFFFTDLIILVSISILKCLIIFLYKKNKGYLKN